MALKHAGPILITGKTGQLATALQSTLRKQVSTTMQLAQKNWI
ncbi:MAG: NAD(P)-dependent oxidoreductase [Bacillus sp. (in: Bacteria)]|nr:NAD(P)-dependent oxidoreductase [Bacillus sp. (in: firmicutes)]